MDTGIKKFFRSILFRLLLFNVLLVFLPVAGVLYLDTFEKQLLQAQENSMVQQARVLSASLSNQGPLDKEKAVLFLKNLNGQSKTRLRVVDPEGRLLADSSTLFTPEPDKTEAPYSGRYDKETLLNSARTPLLYRISVLPVRLYRKLFQPPVPVKDAGFYNSVKPFNGEEISKALEGKYGAVTRLSLGGQRSVTMYSALPVFDHSRVIGVVLASQSTYRILRDLYEMRLVVLKVFLVSFIAAVFISLFLYYTIAFRIRRLEKDAVLITAGRGEMKGSFKPFRFNDEIGQLSLSLKDLTDRLDSHLKDMDDFISDFSHEFKNPLSVVSSASEMIPGSAVEQQERFTKLVNQNIRRMELLLVGVRDLTLLGRELSGTRRDKLDLVLFVQDCMEGFKLRFPALQWILKGDAPISISIPEEHMRRVLINLYENAVSFTPESGDIITGIEIEKNNVLITVFNEGPPIPENDLEKIFSRFYSNRTGSRELHSGLGLSIARTIVESLGGRITAENRSNGVLFTIRIPG